jgi:hypothetical protein
MIESDHSGAQLLLSNRSLCFGVDRKNGSGYIFSTVVKKEIIKNAKIPH